MEIARYAGSLSSSRPVQLCDHARCVDAQVLTNDRYRASNHRVRAMSKRERFSAAFFFNPAYDAEIKPLHTCVDLQEGPHYRSDASQLRCAMHHLHKFYHREKEPKRVKMESGHNSVLSCRPISWREYRSHRFAGDYAQLGEEVQIEHYRVN